MVILREYQKEGIRKIFHAWNPIKENLKNVLFQMPTATGKTTVFSEIVRKAKVKNKKVLIVVHRKELVEQIVNRLARFDIDAGLIASGSQYDSEKDIQVATIQTLARRKSPPADIIIVDEAHHSTAATYKRLWEHYPDARFLGVTATPTRLNGDGFKDQYETLITIGNLSYFIDNESLVPIKHMVCSVPDLSNVKSRMKDYDLSMLSEVMVQEGIMAELVESYKKHANGKKAIVFAVDVNHSKSIVEKYLAEGITAAHLDSKTNKKERERILDKFRQGEITILSNVDIVSEGLDVPDCEVVQLARPTKSLVLYLQQVGRCMRPSAGKDHAIVLDNAGLWLEHGLSHIDRDWSLEGTKRKKKRTTSEVGLDNSGIVREVKKPREVIGLELVEMTEEYERLLKFEAFVRFAQKKEHKLISALYKYRDYLVQKSIPMSVVEAEYVMNRMKNLGVEYKSGFYTYHLPEEIQKLILEKVNSSSKSIH